MKRVAALIAALVFLGLGGAAGWWFYRPIWRVEQAVKARLVDPASARFDHVRYDRRTHAGCGQLSAKDEAGRDVPSMPFVLDPDGNVDVLPAPQAAESAPQTLERHLQEDFYRKESLAYCNAG